MTKRTAKEIEELKVHLRQLQAEKLKRKDMAVILGLTENYVHTLFWHMAQEETKRPGGGSPRDRNPSQSDPASPLNRAKALLDGRLSEKGGYYWLDGHPTSLDRIMQAANRILKARGKPQYSNSPNWPV